MGKSDYKAEALKHKYSDLPDENKSKSRKKKSRPKKANHKHNYENCLVETNIDAFGQKHETTAYWLGSYCTECGKLNTYKPDGVFDSFNKNRVFPIFGYLPSCPYNGNTKNYEDIVETAKKNYTVFRIPGFNAFEKKYIEL